jgi:hypothetical protein
MAITYVESTDFTSGGAATPDFNKSITFSGAASGDLLVVIGLAESWTDGNATESNIATTSGSTGTWTVSRPTSTASDAEAIIGWASVSSTASVTVRVNCRVADTGQHMGVAGWLIPAAEWTGTPALSVNTPDATGDNATIPLTFGNQSKVFYACADWAAVTASTTSTPATGATNHESTLDTGRYTAWVRSWSAQASASSTPYGPGSVTGADSAIVACVVQEATGSGATVTHTPTSAVTAASTAPNVGAALTIIGVTNITG